MSRKVVLLGTLATVCLGAAAEALPFWGDGSPVPSYDTLTLEL